jgi:hypothetical protein
MWPETDARGKALSTTSSLRPKVTRYESRVRRREIQAEHVLACDPPHNLMLDRHGFTLDVNVHELDHERGARVPTEEQCLADRGNLQAKLFRQLAPRCIQQ